mmetsp:Transcript_26391/g.23326  ORF Transcript_26391/g.23326 Transcript_26391/m.23326 type:complete len:84 (+) Transcript_26391:1100-1351(+)
MDFTTAFIKEVLRLSGPNPFMFYRDPPDGYNMAGKVTFKKGTLVTYCPSLLHYNEKFFSRPLEFIPERFIAAEDPFPNDGWKT